MQQHRQQAAAAAAAAAQRLRSATAASSTQACCARVSSMGKWATVLTPAALHLMRARCDDTRPASIASASKAPVAGRSDERGVLLLENKIIKDLRPREIIARLKTEVWRARRVAPEFVARRHPTRAALRLLGEVDARESRRQALLQLVRLLLILDHERVQVLPARVLIGFRGRGGGRACAS
jgi:hypothetical protein